MIGVFEMKIKYCNLNKKSLEGKFFNSWLNEEIIQQGRILVKAEDYYLACFYDLNNGSEYEQKLIKLDELLNFTFYDTAYNMCLAYAKLTNQWENFESKEKSIIENSLYDNPQDINENSSILPIEKAKQFILNLLSDQPKPAKEFIYAPKYLEFSRKTLWNAKKILNVRSYKNGETWYWALPNQEVKK
jgi:hypothetical protein